MRKGREGSPLAPRLREPEARWTARPYTREGRKARLTNFAKARSLAGMATMNISLPDDMKAWVEAQAASGRYGNSSDVVRDLVRRAQVREEKIANMQRLVDEGLASGIDDRPLKQIMADIKSGVGLTLE